MALLVKWDIIAYRELIQVHEEASVLPGRIQCTFIKIFQGKSG
jgi:hypothetical protein